MFRKSKRAESVGPFFPCLFFSLSCCLKIKVAAGNQPSVAGLECPGLLKGEAGTPSSAQHHCSLLTPRYSVCYNIVYPAAYAVMAEVSRTESTETELGRTVPFDRRGQAEDPVLSMNQRNWGSVEGPGVPNLAKRFERPPVSHQQGPNLRLRTGVCFALPSPFNML